MPDCIWLTTSRLHTANPHGLHRRSYRPTLSKELQSEVLIMFYAKNSPPLVIIGGYFCRFSKTSFTTGRAENAFGQPA
jgi:hypothetical protein